MTEKKTIPETRTTQLWPRGTSVMSRGNVNGPRLEIREGKVWRRTTSSERHAIKTEELAEAYAEHDILCCDSVLVDEFASEQTILSGVAEAFSIENWENLYPDPSDWTVEQCREWLQDMGYEAIAVYADDNLEANRTAVNARAEPAEVMEWWRVTQSLCVELREIGEVVIDNDYGCWWGRTCTGQGLIMDGTLQKIAAKYA